MKLTASWGPSSALQRASTSLEAHTECAANHVRMLPRPPAGLHPCERNGLTASQARAQARYHHTHSSHPGHSRRMYAAHKGAPLKHVALEMRGEGAAGLQRTSSA